MKSDLAQGRRLRGAVGVQRTEEEKKSDFMKLEGFEHIEKAH